MFSILFYILNMEKGDFFLNFNWLKRRLSQTLNVIIYTHTHWQKIKIRHV
jgi:hypothetical protein